MNIFMDVSHLVDGLSKPQNVARVNDKAPQGTARQAFLVVVPALSGEEHRKGNIAEATGHPDSDEEKERN